MASLRKKYQEQFNGHANGAAKDVRPVATAPKVVDAPPVEDAPKPIEVPEKTAEPDNPAEDAAKNFMRDRINEMANAEALVRQQLKAPQPQQSETTQDPLETFLEKLPEPTQKFLRANTQYLTDAEKNAALQHFHNVAKRETGEEHTPRYIESLEIHLGLRQRSQPQPNGNGNGVQRVVQAAPQRQQSAPAPRGPQVSAPPTREVPSMSTGRPVISGQVHLDSDEKQVALASRHPGDTDEMAIRRYAANKLRLQQQGLIGPGTRDGRG